MGDQYGYLLSKKVFSGTDGDLCEIFRGDAISPVEKLRFRERESHSPDMCVSHFSLHWVCRETCFKCTCFKCIRHIAEVVGGMEFGIEERGKVFHLISKVMFIKKYTVLEQEEILEIINLMQSLHLLPHPQMKKLQPQEVKFFTPLFIQQDIYWALTIFQILF